MGVGKTWRKNEKGNLIVVEPKFRKELSLEQQTDPDYRLKQLAMLNEGKLSLTCSRCHHCRR